MPWYSTLRSWRISRDCTPRCLTYCCHLQDLWDGVALHGASRQLVLFCAQVTLSGMISSCCTLRGVYILVPEYGVLLHVCSALHRFKAVYVAVHARHHELGSNVTAYGTAVGEALDYGLCICLFHFLVYLYLRTSADWSPVALGAAFFAEVRHVCADIAPPDAKGFHTSICFKAVLTRQVATDISGHCGYEGNVCFVKTAESALLGVHR